MAKGLPCLALPTPRQAASEPEHGLQGKERQEQLVALLQKYMLKRMKKVVLQDVMPDKSDKIVFCTLSELQLRTYRRAPCQ